MCKKMTTQDDKIKILNNCLKQCESRLEKNISNQPLLIIKEVIESILSVVLGNTKVSPEMEENNKIGLFAVREFEPHDIEFANSIYKVIDLNNEIRVSTE